MLIGGQAVLLHGRPRLTDDVDVTLGVGPDRLDRVLEACGAIGLDPLPTDVPGFVAETFVLPTRHPASAMRVDLIFSTLLYEAEAIGRAVRIPIGGAEVPFATAEDLVVHKLFAGRPRDLEDIVGVIRRQGDAMDWAYVTRWVVRSRRCRGANGSGTSCGRSGTRLGARSGVEAADRPGYVPAPPHRWPSCRQTVQPSGNGQVAEWLKAHAWRAEREPAKS